MSSSDDGAGRVDRFVRRTSHALKISILALAAVDRKAVYRLAAKQKCPLGLPGVLFDPSAGGDAGNPQAVSAIMRPLRRERSDRSPRGGERRRPHPAAVPAASGLNGRRQGWSGRGLWVAPTAARPWPGPRVEQRSSRPPPVPPPRLPRAAAPATPDRPAAPSPNRRTRCTPSPPRRARAGATLVTVSGPP